METQTANSRWVHSPAADLLIGCCGWTLPIMLVAYLVPGGTTLGLGLYSLTLVLNFPHYMATVHRAYRTKEDFLRYRVVTLYFTLVMTALLATAHVSHRLVPWVFTLYITWSPWHYMGQNFGLSMMFIRRNGIQVERKDRHALWAAFVISYALKHFISWSFTKPTACIKA